MISYITVVFFIGFFIAFVFFLTWAVLDADVQKEELRNMSCDELRNYLIEKATTNVGFQGIAKQLFKYKCEIK